LGPLLSALAGAPIKKQGQKLLSRDGAAAAGPYLVCRKDADQNNRISCVVAVERASRVHDPFEGNPGLSDARGTDGMLPPY
jgi:hypothetical protein